MFDVLRFVIWPFSLLSRRQPVEMLNSRISNWRISKAGEDGSAFQCSVLQPFLALERAT